MGRPISIVVLIAISACRASPDPTPVVNPSIVATESEQQILVEVARHLRGRMGSRRIVLDPRQLGMHVFHTPEEHGQPRRAPLSQAVASALEAVEVRRLEDVQTCVDYPDRPWPVCHLSEVDAVVFVSEPRLMGDSAVVQVSVYTNAERGQPTGPAIRYLNVRDDLVTLLNTDAGWQVVRERLLRIGHWRPTGSVPLVSAAGHNHAALGPSTW